MSRISHLPPRCPPPSSKENDLSDLIRYPSLDTIIEEHPSWLDEVITNSNNNPNLNNGTVRRSASDSTTILESSFLQCHEFGGGRENCSGFERECVYGPNSPRQKSNVSETEANALMESMPVNKLQYLMSDSMKQTELKDDFNALGCGFDQDKAARSRFYVIDACFRLFAGETIISETCKMNSRIKMDRISVLPKNIIDSILTCIPILEAVRTSILSRCWRYQWHSLSKININGNDLLRVSLVERVKIIDHILFLHCGSIDKFKLGINLDAHNDIDRWILYLSRNGIKELIIESGSNYSLPACLFSCSDLTHLELTRCMLKLPLAAFKAFSNLTELFLKQVTISDQILGSILNSCPLLSRLSLLSVILFPSLKINAPKLVMFHISNFSSLKINTPLLDSASFGFQFCLISVGGNCKIAELLGSMPILRRLELNQFALQQLAGRYVPACLPLVCPIKHLIVWINFNTLQEMLAAFCIFRSSPLIRILDLTFVWKAGYWSTSADEFWKGKYNFNFRFDHLQEARMTCFTGTEYELKFIEFLLANAPALQTMEIKFLDDKSVNKNVEDLFSMISRLTRFPRISPKAELILPSNMSLILQS